MPNINWRQSNQLAPTQVGDIILAGIFVSRIVSYWNIMANMVIDFLFLLNLRGHHPAYHTLTAHAAMARAPLAGGGARGA